MNSVSINYNTDDFVFIERCFGAIKDKIDVDENLCKIERALNRIFDINFKISIDENNLSGVFYGVNIFPTLNTMDLMVGDIVEHEKSSIEIEKFWAENDIWHIEIDSVLLYDMSLGANPAEITAVMLHEIGHVVFSSDIPRILHSIFRHKMSGLNYQMRMLFKNKKIRKLLNIAIVDACSTKNFMMSECAESDADKFVSFYDYGTKLDSFIHKMIVRYGNENINKTVAEVNKDVEIFVNWTILNIRELEFRKTQLKDALKVEMLKNPSSFIKKIVQDVYNTFFGEVTDRYRQLLSEQYMSVPTDKYAELQAEQNFSRFVTKVVAEAASGKNMFDKNGKLKKISQSDIDVLYVESDNIKTVDDKIYLLDKAYNYIEMVNTALDYLATGEREMTSRVTQSKNTLISMRNQLEQIRLTILSTKIIEKEWGTFVRMPKGYEG